MKKIIEQLIINNRVNARSARLRFLRIAVITISIAITLLAAKACAHNITTRGDEMSSVFATKGSNGVHARLRAYGTSVSDFAVPADRLTIMNRVQETLVDGIPLQFIDSGDEVAFEKNQQITAVTVGGETWRIGAYTVDLSTTFANQIDFSNQLAETVLLQLNDTGANPFLSFGYSVWTASKLQLVRTTSGSYFYRNGATGNYLARTDGMFNDRSVMSLRLANFTPSDAGIFQAAPTRKYWGAFNLLRTDIAYVPGAKIVNPLPAMNQLTIESERVQAPGLIEVLTQNSLAIDMSASAVYNDLQHAFVLKDRATQRRDVGTTICDIDLRAETKLLGIGSYVQAVADGPSVNEEILFDMQLDVDYLQLPDASAWLTLLYVAKTIPNLP